MLNRFCMLLLLAAAFVQSAEQYSFSVVRSKLRFPWELTWGPDSMLWATERTGKCVTRINPTTGDTSIALSLQNEVYQTSGQDGLLGMALHPGMLKPDGVDLAYVAFTYNIGTAASPQRRLKIRRYYYDRTIKKLTSPFDCITGLPASSDHNAGRLIIGPDLKLYYSIGDNGSNQFENVCHRNRAQDIPTQGEVDNHDWVTYQGKILRMNLDGSIPDDNPILKNGVRSHIYSFGHRNAQGLVFGKTGILYSAEHGPKTDDEINIIQAGKNYGWPRVVGNIDNMAYEFADWSASSPAPCESLVYSDFSVPASVPRMSESTFSDTSFSPPIKTFFTVPNTYNFQDPACAGNYFICWPTIAPASLDYYNFSTGIPGWNSSLLAVSLKKGCVFRLQLGNNETSLPGDTIGLWRTQNRYRDIAIQPDGLTFYIATDSAGSTSGPSSGYTGVLDNPGSILKFTYLRQPTRYRSVPAAERNGTREIILKVNGKSRRYQLPRDIRLQDYYLEFYDIKGERILPIARSAESVTLPEHAYIIVRIRDGKGANCFLRMVILSQT
jgi:PQQ-dependent dehydrogenase (s-GDH family)